MLGMATICFAAACTREAPPRAPAPTAESTAQPATRIFIDPQTGQPREPTAQELAAAAQAEARVAASGRAKPVAPREVELPNGAVAVILGEETLQPLRACVRPDGRVDEFCGHGDAAAGNVGRDAQAPAR